MNTGTFYLYEYENYKRKRNVGFIKVSQHYQSCILQIHVRGIPVRSGSTLILSAFCCEQDAMIMSQIAELTSCGRNISIRLSVSETHFPGRRALQQIDGFLLQNPDRDAPPLFWMASSFFFDIRPDMMQTDEPKAETASEAEAVPEPETAPEPESAPKPAAAPEPESASELEAASTPAPEPALQSVEAKELPQDRIGEDSFPLSDHRDASVISQQCREMTEARRMPNPASTAVDLQAYRAKKISRSDLTLLPRKFWPLANNSFLLHGYHNYNHLALIEENGRRWLGVPGIYDTREARAADLFGFPRFTRAYVSVLELTDEERNDTADFGHWCRCVGTCSPGGTPPASSGNFQASPAPDSRLK